MEDNFFGNAPDNYEVPKSETRYMNFKTPGKYTFRILQAPIFGWQGWKLIDGKNTPFRFPMDQKPTDASSFKDGKLTHFWAMPVFNFNDGKVEVLELTQKSLQEAIETYARSEWGSPLGYNLTVTREGTGRDDTKYSAINGPKSELTPEAAQAWADVQAAGFDITELYRGGEPFEPSTAAETPAQAAPAQVEPEITEPVDTATPPN
jgi:hypothetical protein